MPYRSPARNRTSFSSRGGQSVPRNFVGKNYNSEQTGIRRHIYDSAVFNSGVLTAGIYAFIPVIQFRRSFTASPDEDPTPTASNNYQTPDVMNGSKVRNLSAVIHITPQNASVSGYLSIYEIAVSFWDALVWDTVLPTSCPITFDTSANDEGEINYKTPTATLVVGNLHKSYTFIQRYMKYRGQVFVPAGLAGNPSIDIHIKGIPPKCRRSQTGMAYGIILHNDATVNGSRSLDQKLSFENSFEEIPSTNRLPYLF